MTAGNAITVISRKFDGSLSRSWVCRLVSVIDNSIELEGEFDRSVEHAHLGPISRGTVSHEFFWLDRLYNVFRFHEPDGKLRNYYCNITMLPKLDDDILEYVDLDIDLILWPDGEIEVLDHDEFEMNAELFKYPPELVANVESTLDAIVRDIHQRRFPFDAV